jgi:hypothetical protein
MEEFLKFLICVFSAILYGTSITNLVSFIFGIDERYILHCISFFILALLMDILNELKKFNDKNKLL